MKVLEGLFKDNWTAFKRCLHWQSLIMKLQMAGTDNVLDLVTRYLGGCNTNIDQSYLFCLTKVAKRPEAAKVAKEAKVSTITAAVAQESFANVINPLNRSF